MSFRYWLLALAVLILGLLPVVVFWIGWQVARVEVEPDTFLVVTNRWGQPLPEGAIVAPDGTYKGIQRKVLPEGQYFLNPLWYTYERHNILKVPEKYCAVLIRKAGTEISAERKANGEFLARGPIDLDAKLEPGERGIVEQVLGPGKYRINPYEYDYELVQAVEIQSQQVGVKILRWGEEPPKDRPNPYIVADGQRGVQQTLVPSGTHYINPYVVEIIPVDLRAHTVIFEDIEFPSKDGFTIEPRVEVRYKVMPEKVSELFVLLCENGVLYQHDETLDDQGKNPILQKIVLPLIRGYVRIEGSKHDAREYISKPKDEEEMPNNGKTSNPRERLQEELMAKVKPECAKVGVDLEYVAVGQPRMNRSLEELASQIREREQARITRKTNEQKVIQFEREQKLKSTEALAQQRQRIIDANTSLEQAKIIAERRVQNEKAKLGAELQSAQARLDGAKKRAEAILTQGKAEANIIMAENEAVVAELKKAVDGFPTPDHFAQYHVLAKLSPALAEIFASDTSEFAKLFSTYMAPGSRKIELAGPVPSEPKVAETDSDID
ncbi:MAG: SPFH domain-containing protein [Gemmataceae bacterium]